MIAKILKSTGILKKGVKVEIEFTDQLLPTGDKKKYTARAFIDNDRTWPLYDHEYKILSREKYPEEYL